MEENTGAVKFEGQPPFLLPEAKSAQADVFETQLTHAGLTARARGRE
jgi:hypothetical protein